jgi:hypothetical protein
MREVNWKPGQTAELSVLGEGSSTTSAVQSVTILEFGGKRMRVATDRKVRGGAAVRLEWDGQLILGEVQNTEPDGFWVEVRHLLLDTAMLDWQKNGWQRA